MPLDPRIVKESFAEIEPHGGDTVIAYFYSRLFADSPGLRAFFPPMMDGHRDRFFRALTRIVWSLDSPDSLTAYLSRLGRAHRKFGVAREHYDDIGRALIATLRRFAGTRWNDEVEAAWGAAYATVAETMAAAAEEDAATAPPWWIGEVVGHERRGRDVAVVTLRPHQRLPHQAGQYLSVQTARWPRVWRPYSIANAPRADGTLSLHVRARPGGWVSGTLVRHTQTGNTLLLGPADGSMTLPPDYDGDLLCVAGGTGLAPLKALVEAAVAAAAARPRGERSGTISLVCGARTAEDLYDLPDLRRLEAGCPRLRVIPVVSDDPGYRGVRGTVADALEQFGDWRGHEVYVAGPEAMIGHTVATLQGLGVPPARIHHDPVGGGQPLVPPRPADAPAAAPVAVPAAVPVSMPAPVAVPAAEVSGSGTATGPGPRPVPEGEPAFAAVPDPEAAPAGVQELARAAGFSDGR